MNPFVQNIALPVIQVNEVYTISPRPKREIVIDATNWSFTKSFWIDKESKTGLYKIANSPHLIFRILKPSGRDLLLYITLALKKEQDYVELIHRVVCERMDISRGTLHSGITQLTQNGIIAKRDSKSYWINPMHLFNGNRYEYFKSLGDEHINVITQVNG